MRVLTITLLSLLAQIYAEEVAADTQKDDKTKDKADLVADDKDDLADLLAQLPQSDEDMDKLADKLADKLVDRAASAFNATALDDSALDGTALFKPGVDAGAQDNINLDELQKHFKESLDNINLDELQNQIKETLDNLNLDDLQSHLNAAQDPNAIHDAIRNFYGADIYPDEEEGAAARPYDEDMDEGRSLQAMQDAWAKAFQTLAAGQDQQDYNQEAAESEEADPRQESEEDSDEELVETSSPDYLTMALGMLFGLFVGSSATFVIVKYRRQKVRHELPGYMPMAC